VISPIFADPLRALSNVPSPLLSKPTEVMRAPKATLLKSDSASSRDDESNVELKLRTASLPMPEVPTSTPTS
jgi:hypothetical protein